MKIGRNEPCPCGSGKKYKKCCIFKAPARFSWADQVSAKARINAFLDRPEVLVASSWEYAWFFDYVSSDYPDRYCVLEHCILSNEAFKAWYLFDAADEEDGSFKVDELLREAMPAGERRYILALRDTVLRPYVVIATEPQGTIILRDLIREHDVRVDDERAARLLGPGNLIAARVAPPGPQGIPELYGGFLPQVTVSHEQLRAQVLEKTAALRLRSPQASELETYREVAPVFHRHWFNWLASIGISTARGTVEDTPNLDAEAEDRELDAAEVRLYEEANRWLHEAQPMFDGLTPLEAVKSQEALPALHAHLRREPALDPSFLWQKLGLRDEENEAGASAYPPNLGHARMAWQIPGLDYVAAAIAKRLRREAGSDMPGTIAREKSMSQPEIRRFVAEQALAAAIRRGTPYPALEWDHFAAPLEVYTNFELHLRKIFWLDWKLSWMMGASDPDAAGKDLKLPFPSFAIVFTDRYALGLAERVVSRWAEDPGRRGLLRIVTAYITELAATAPTCRIRLTFVCDALDLRGPYIIEREVVIDPDQTLDAIIDRPDSRLRKDRGYTMLPMQQLLRLTFSVILYTTGANAVIERRDPPPRASEPQVPSTSNGYHPSDSVYYLGGKIDITLLRQVQHEVRSQGGELSSRSLVRGHFRRPNPDWKDQRLRWIGPYWRGPDDAVIVERDYRLKP